MFLFRHCLALLLPILLFGTLTAQDSTVVDIIVASDDHNTLEAAVLAADLVETLSGEGPFTVFAPTDAAFDALPLEVLDFLLDEDNRDSLVSVLTYHVVGDSVGSADLMDGTAAATLNDGDSLFIRSTDDGVTVNGVMVTVADINADNGVVHVIDAVLMQPQASIVDIIAASEIHTTLATAIDLSGLGSALTGEGPFTVFAPTDAAFDALPAETLAALLADPTGDLADALQYHVVSGKVFSTDLSDGMFVETLQGDSLYIRSVNDTVTVNGATVVAADLQADNGVVHAIDQVLTMPMATVVDVVVNDTMLTTLETAVTEAGLVDALSGDGPFTIFAPNDSAFAGLADGVLDSLLLDPTGDLATVLQFHVVPGRFLSSDLSEGLMLTTLEGEDLTIGLDGGATVNDIDILQTDIVAGNGVVHIIGGVLLPESITSVREPAFAAEVSIAPNPASSYTTVFLPASIIGETELTLRDMTGRTLKRMRATGVRQQLDTGALPAGTYLLEVRAKAGAIQRRIVVR